MKTLKDFVASSILLLGVAAEPASAAMISITLPEFNTVYNNGPTFYTFDVGQFVFSIPTGQQIVSASVAGQFGNSLDPTAALEIVTLGGIPVASCTDQSQPCWRPGLQPWSYNFSPAQFSIFSAGSAMLSDQQIGCCSIRLGHTTLQLTTAPVPEPDTYATMIAGLALLSVIAHRRPRGSSR